MDTGWRLETARGLAVQCKLDGTVIPSASPTVSAPAWITMAVAVAAPATIASASPHATIIPPQNSDFITIRRATPGVMSSRPLT